MALCPGTFLFVYWLVALADGEASYETARALIGSFIGRLLLFGWSVALFYHLCNGIRHLVWDVGLGLGLPAIYRSGWAVVGTTAGLTLASWIAGYAVMGSF